MSHNSPVSSDSSKYHQMVEEAARFFDGPPASRHMEYEYVPKDRQFVGLDGFKKAIDSLDRGDVVLLATPPAFRPIHLDYAVQKGMNVFMEKSFAVDAPGVRRVPKAGEAATKKNLKVAGGLMSRHYKPLEDCVAPGCHRGTQTGRLGGHDRGLFAPRGPGSDVARGREPVAP